MSNYPGYYVADQDIPLHMFRDLSETIDQIPFIPFTFGDEVLGSLASYPHRHNFYEIFYVTDGKGTHFIDFHAYPLESNTFYFITPGQVHH